MTGLLRIIRGRWRANTRSVRSEKSRRRRRHEVHGGRHLNRLCQFQGEQSRGASNVPATSGRERHEATLRPLREQVHAVIVAASLCSGGACGHAPKAAANSTGTCVPTGTDVVPTRMALTGATLRFCLAEPAGTGTGTLHCYTANLEAKTIAPTSPPTDASAESRPRKDFPLWAANGRNPASASLDPSAHGKGMTACTSDKTACHDLPIDAASLGDKPIAVSDDATLVAIDTRNPKDTRRLPGRLETWDAVTGKKLASFEIHYGPTTEGYETPNHVLEFLGHTVIAYTESACALPCSSATMYSVRGKYLGLLASDPTGARAEQFHDELYLLYSQGPDWPLVVQDMATGKSVQLDDDRNASWDTIVTPAHIVRVVAPSRSNDSAPRSPRVEVWEPDLKLASTIAVPTCVPPTRSVRGR